MEPHLHLQPSQQAHLLPRPVRLRPCSHLVVAVLPAQLDDLLDASAARTKLAAWGVGHAGCGGCGGGSGVRSACEEGDVAMDVGVDS